jgi:hypothetical protein
MSDELRVHRMQRKLVMQYLLAKGFVPVDPLRLLYHLRDLRYACTRATLNFHLSYLAEANWISVEWKKEVIGEEGEILSVKITRPGVDALDAGELDVAIASA